MLLSTHTHTQRASLYHVNKAQRTDDSRRNADAEPKLIQQASVSVRTNAHLVLFLEIVDATLLVSDGLIPLTNFTLERADVLLQRGDGGVQLSFLWVDKQ